MEKDSTSAYADDDSPEFFRIYFAKTCSQELRIPRGFVPKFHGNVPPQNVVLEGPKGRRWQIVLKEKDQSLFFAEGWPHFVGDNSLVDGDFLTFCQDGGSNFYVKIFGKHACRKDVALTRRSSDNVSEFSYSWTTRGRLRPRDDTRKVVSTRLRRPRDETGNELVLVDPFTKRTLCPGDDVGESSNIGLIGRTQHLAENTDKKFIGARLTTTGQRLMCARYDKGQFVSSQLDNVSKFSNSWATRGRLRPRDDTGNVVSAKLRRPKYETDGELVLVDPFTKRTSRLGDDVGDSSNTGLIGRTQRLSENADKKFLETRLTTTRQRLMRARDEKGKFVSSPLAENSCLSKLFIHESEDNAGRSRANVSKFSNSWTTGRLRQRNNTGKVVH